MLRIGSFLPLGQLEFQNPAGIIAGEQVLQINTDIYSQRAGNLSLAHGYILAKPGNICAKGVKATFGWKKFIGYLERIRLHAKYPAGRCSTEDWLGKSP